MIRRYAFRIGMAVTALWVGLVSLAIARQPAPGAADPAGLAAAYQHALAARDPGAVEHLLVSPPRGTGEQLLAADTEACGAGARVRAGGAFLELSTVEGRGCGRLPIARHDGRWYVDPWAPLRG